MENKELNNPMLNELDEDVLGHVSGGNETVRLNSILKTNDPLHYFCPKCGCSEYLIATEQLEYRCGSCGWVSDDDGNDLPDDITTSD